MKPSISLVLLAIALPIAFAIEISSIVLPNNLRNPGDVLFSQCNNVTVSGQHINNVCVTLKEDDDCGVTVILSIAGTQVINDNLDLEASPEVCGVYSVSGVSCNLCVSLVPNPSDNTQICILITPTCLGNQLPAQTVSCIPESTFDNVVSCSGSICPNACSGHGTCTNGTCICNAGYYTVDCSATEPIFSQCVQVDDLTGQICVRLNYAPCTIDVETFAIADGQEMELFHRNISVKYLSTVFQDDMCASLGICDVCVHWSNLILNTSEASGCGSLTISCPGKDYPYDIGCFEDHDVLPSCFVCPNNCSGHGSCSNYGICSCTSYYTGEDCSSTTPCPQNCNGHGTCSPYGVCTCNQDWTGTSCSIQKDNSSSSKAGSSHTTAIAASIITILLLGAVAGGVFYYLRRRNRSTEAKFTQLDMITANDEDMDDVHH